jgi:geranylgeranylglycerol-phosphate geranylgeranyltransferase
MFGYLRIIRPLNCVMTAVAVFIGGLLVANLGALFFAEKIYLAMAAAFLIAGAGNIINDYVDMESDRINRPKRPIPSGQIGRKSALAFSILLFLVGIFLAGFINWIAFGIAVFNSLLLIAYSLCLQNKLLLGNISISYLVGSGFLFGGVALGNPFLPLVLMLLAFFANLSREIVKDLEDIEGDRKSFLKRIAAGIKKSIAERFGFTGGGAELKYGRRKLKIIAGFSLLLAIAVSPLPYMLGILGLSYLIILIPTDLVFLISALFLTRTGSSKGFHRISRMIKLGMLLGLIAFIVGALV